LNIEEVSDVMVLPFDGGEWFMIRLRRREDF